MSCGGAAPNNLTMSGNGKITNNNLLAINGSINLSGSALIENNVTSRSQQQHGIYFANSADRPILRGNTVWGNRVCGIHMNGDRTQGGAGIIKGALVENNVIYDNGQKGGAGINADFEPVAGEAVAEHVHAAALVNARTDFGLQEGGPSGLVVDGAARVARLTAATSMPPRRRPGGTW